MSPVLQQKVEILTRAELAHGVFQMEMHSPRLVSLGRPGQFLHLRVGQGTTVFLRRPLSIFKTVPEKGTVGLLFRVVGRGTRELSRMEVGDSLDLIGPLGRGFSVPGGMSTALLVAGGMGVAPLFFLAQVLIDRGARVRFLLGAREEEQLLCSDELRALGAQLAISTDDGSRGFHGLVTQLLEHLLEKERLDPQTTAIYATGPEPMMMRVASLARRRNMHAQFSLERHIACGLGACLGCVVPCRSEDGGWTYRRVCAEGPVFDLDEVLWNS